MTPGSLDQLLSGGRRAASDASLEGLLDVDEIVLASWALSRHAARLAESILDAEREQGMLYRFTVGVSALTILFEALSQFVDSRVGVDTLPVDSRDAARAYQARRPIVAHLEREITLPQIVVATGMSVSTPQRVLK